MIPGLAAFAATAALGIIVVTLRWRRLRRFRSGLRPLPLAAIRLAWLIARICAALGTTTHTALNLIQAAERLRISRLFLGRLSEGWWEELWADALHIHGQRGDRRRSRIAIVCRACYHLAAAMLPASMRRRYVGDWLGETDGLPLGRQIRFAIRVLVRAPATAHAEGSYARLVRASLIWAFPAEVPSKAWLDEQRGIVYGVSLDAMGGIGIAGYLAWSALGVRLGITAKPGDQNDRPL